MIEVVKRMATQIKGSSRKVFEKISAREDAFEIEEMQISQPLSTNL
jgi:hypothetical protein